MKNTQNTIHSQRRQVVLPELVTPLRSVGELVTPLRSVGQDKPLNPTARISMTQPASVSETQRAHARNKKTARTQKRTEHKRKTVKLTAWVHPGVKAELERIAEREGLSLSATAATALEEWVAQSLNISHAGIIQPVIKQAIAKDLRSYSTRLAILLVRSLFVSEQTRILVANMVGKGKMTEGERGELLERSKKSAKRNITQVHPQLEDLVKEMDQWLLGEKGKQHEQ